MSLSRNFDWIQLLKGYCSKPQKVEYISIPKDAGMVFIKLESPDVVRHPLYRTGAFVPLPSEMVQDGVLCVVSELFPVENVDFTVTFGYMTIENAVQLYHMTGHLDPDQDLGGHLNPGTSVFTTGSGQQLALDADLIFQALLGEKPENRGEAAPYLIDMANLYIPQPKEPDPVVVKPEIKTTEIQIPTKTKVANRPKSGCKSCQPTNFDPRRPDQQRVKIEEDRSRESE